MGLFDIFKSKKKEITSSETQSTLLNGSADETSKVLLVEKLIKSVQGKTKANCFSFQVEDETPDLFSTKIGGTPYWDTKLSYPTDKDNNPLALVFQINFADLPQDKNQIDKENLLPTEGILQFFISPDDDYYGMDTDNYSNQEKFRVIYHENIDSNITMEDMEKFISEKFNAELPKTFGPVQSEAKLSIKSDESYLSLESETFQEIFQESVKEVFHEETEDDYRSFLDDKNFDNGKKYGGQFFRALTNNKSYILGKPTFTQEEPECAQSYDTLLLKLDSSDELMWGDTGICNLFINKEKLKSKDFSDIAYYWDCC